MRFIRGDRRGVWWRHHARQNSGRGRVALISGVFSPCNNRRLRRETACNDRPEATRLVRSPACIIDVTRGRRSHDCSPTSSPAPVLAADRPHRICRPPSETRVRYQMEMRQGGAPPATCTAVAVDHHVARGRESSMSRLRYPSTEIPCSCARWLIGHGPVSDDLLLGGLNRPWPSSAEPRLSDGRGAEVPSFTATTQSGLNPRRARSSIAAEGKSLF